MKTQEQIKEWLESQPYYETLKSNVVKSGLMDGRSIRILLGGAKGGRTMSNAVLFLDPDMYDWDKIEKEFMEWYDKE